MTQQVKKSCKKAIKISFIILILGVIVLLASYQNIMKLEKQKQIKQRAIETSTGFSKISIRDFHALAIDMSGNLWAWGYNRDGQLGNGSTANSSTPVQVKSGTTFKEVATGNGWSLAIDTSGNLWGWGNNTFGQLGNGSTTSSNVPIQIKAGTKFSKISAGGGQSLAIDTSGNLWGWGSNTSKNLQNSTQYNILTPIQIKAGTKFKEIEGAMQESFAIDTSGNLWGWGRGYLVDSDTPTIIKSGTTFTKISTSPTGAHALAIDASGNLWVWGDNQYGQLGNGTTSTTVTTTLTQVKPGTKFKEISAGRQFSLAIDTSGNLWGWGCRKYGELGEGVGNTGSNIIQTTPIQLKKGSTFTMASGGANTSIVLDTNRNLWGTGYNTAGELADGTVTNSNVFIQIPKYRVYLSSEGGTTAGTTMVMGTYVAPMPNITIPTKTGYNFEGYYTGKNGTGTQYYTSTGTSAKDWDLMQESKFLYAKWTATTASYKIEHYQQNIAKTGYTLKETENKTGTTDTTATATKKTYTGFTENTTYSGRKASGTITADGKLVLKLYYDRNTYNVTLNTNGGTIPSGSNITSYTYGVQENLPTPTKTGYTFGGWYTTSSLTGTAVTRISSTDTGAKTYYAKWTASTNTAYKVEHYQQNTTKTGYALKETENKTGTTATTVNATKKTYTGFTENTTYSGRKASGTVAANGSLVLKLYYDRDTYSVSLNTNGGTIPSGSSITRYTYGVEQTLPTPTKAGYTFAGWYTTSNLTGTAVTKISTTDSGAKTYYAKWTGNTNTAYKVEHYKQNITLTGYELVTDDVQNLTGTTDETVTAIAKNYTGFTENTTYSGRKASGTVVADGSLVLKLYYDRNHYKVTLNANGGTITPGTDITNYTYGIAKTLPTPIKTGYTFGGWYADSGFTGVELTKISETDIEEKTYYAKWIGNTDTAYTIEHYKQNTALNGYDLVTTDTENKTGITDVEVTAKAKTYPGFSENTSHSERKASGVVAPDGSLVLKLYYDRNSYPVTLNKNGGTISSGSDVTSYIYGIEESLPILTKVGYAFGGWYTNANFTGNAVTEINKTEVGEKTYYAKWTAGTNIPYRVEHYQQNTALNGYDLVVNDIQNLAGVTDTEVTANAKIYTGFIENTTHSERRATGTVSADGSLVLKLYYDRNTYQVTLQTNGGILPGEANITQYTYGIEKSLPIPTKLGYTFVGWYTNANFAGDVVTKISGVDIEDKIYYAKWTANIDTTYKIEHYQQNVAKTGYTLKETENRVGTTDTEVVATAKDYTGFNENTSYSERKESGIILADGNLVLRLYYDRNTYEVKFNKNGGIIPNGNEITNYTYGVGTKLPIPTKTGYTFCGWYTDPELTGTAITLITTTDTGAKTYYAKWEAKTDTAYTIEHYQQNTVLNGYDLVEKDTQHLTGTTDTEVTVTAKEYLGFTENTKISVKNGIVSADGNLVLKIYYDRNHYQAILNPNGGTLPEGKDTIEYTYGMEEKLPTPEKEGYTFGGWYDNEELEGEPKDKITSEDVGQKELYAKWEANTNTVYTVEHYQQNTDLKEYTLIEKDTQHLTGTTDAEVIATAKEYPGFTENTKISIKSGTIVADGSLVLKLYYDRNHYQVTLNPNGGTLPEGIDTIEYTHGIEETLPEPEKEGYTFEGWYDNEELEGNPKDKITSEEIGEKELYAKWKANTDTAYTVEHYQQNTDLNEYEIVTTDTEHLTGTTDTIVTATAKGYPGFTENSNISVKSGTIVANGSLVLKIYYDRNHYQVTLNPNGGTLPEGTNPIEYTYGIEETLPEPEKEGYTFVGWYDNEELEGNPKDKITTEDIGEKELYAKWEANTNTPYTVEHYQQNTELNGYEVVTKDTQRLTGTTNTEVTATVKEYPGFTENTNISVKSGTIIANGSLVLKVYYDRNHYQVTLNPNGGTLPEGTDTIEYTYGIEENLPEPEKEGYIFVGWYDNEELEGNPKDKITPEEIGEKDLYAKWEANTNITYRVEHYQQNTDLKNYTLMAKDTENLTGTTDTIVTATVKEYAGFTENTKISIKSGTVVANGSLVLKVYYDRSHYQVTLDPNGGILPEGMDTIEYIYGIEETLPEPEKEGYTFDRWYDNEELEGEPKDKITSEEIGEKELYAKWEANTNTAYTIEHYQQNVELNGYEIVTEDTESLTGTTDVVVTATAKEYSGFTENADISIKSGSIAGDGSLVLRIYYDRSRYEITLNLDGGVLPEGTKAIEYTYGIAKELPIPEKEGYTFIGWYQDKEFSGNPITKIEIGEIGEKEFFAQFRINQYRVTFINEGKEIETKWVNYGETVEAPRIEKPGYVLSWDKDFSKITNHLTIYAIWTPNTNILYKVEHYEQNTEKTGYTLKETETKTGTVGQIATAIAKEYLGFTENKNHAERVENGIIVGDGSLTLKLFYDRNQYHIKLDPAGGTLPEEEETIDYTYGVEKELPTPEKEGYIFGGWYDNEECEGEPTTKITPTDIGNKDYYAKWIKEEEYYIMSEKYLINTVENDIMKVSPNTTAEIFIHNIKTNGIPKIVNAKKEEISSQELVGTGFILQVDYKGTIYEYEIAVRGDLDGNGKVTVTDLSMLNQVLVKKLTLSRIKEKAADIDYNKKITVTDLSMMNQGIVKKIKL